MYFTKRQDHFTKLFVSYSLSDMAFGEAGRNGKAQLNILTYSAPRGGRRRLLGYCQFSLTASRLLSKSGRGDLLRLKYVVYPSWLYIREWGNFCFHSLNASHECNDTVPSIWSVGWLMQDHKRPVYWADKADIKGFFQCRDELAPSPLHLFPFQCRGFAGELYKSWAVNGIAGSVQ